MGLIIVANRAPVRKTEDGWSASIGGLATALLPVLEERGGVWVAMKEEAGMPDRLDYPPDAPRLAVRRIDLSKEEQKHYYEGLSNRVLWPVSHYMLQHVHPDPVFMDDYRRVNARFAAATVEEYHPGDAIWVQDYHLMLAPQHLREALPEAPIALFWHIPWPAMEIFRVLPWARELLRGLLACDLLGFHVEEYVENFLESARVLLGAEVVGNRVRWGGREVRVEAHPIGIDVGWFEQRLADPAVGQAAAALREELRAERLVVGVDRLDYTKGIRRRLQAYERFLERFPDYHGRVTFLQIATPSRTEVPAYRNFKREVDESVGRINGQFGRDDWTPVQYRYRAFTQEELAAVYQAADVALITPLRDGMNLVAQEFIAASREGVLVLSELTGAAYLLSEALQVNPYDRDGLAAALHQALEMPADERRQRLGQLKATVSTLDVRRWANRFLDAFCGEGEQG